MRRGVRHMIHITLRGDPGLRTGTIDLDGDTHEIVTWHKQAGGEVHATTDKGLQVTLALSGGAGGITIGRAFRFISGATWQGTTMTGQTMAGVSDPEMARMFPGCSWGEAT
jgi:hypothetical protein